MAFLRATWVTFLDSVNTNIPKILEINRKRQLANLHKWKKNNKKIYILYSDTALNKDTTYKETNTEIA